MKQLHDSLGDIAHGNRRRIPLGDTYKETDELTAKFCLRPAMHMWPPKMESPNSEIGRLHRLFISRVGLLTQQHNYHHVESCFKSSTVSSRDECRYGFPRPAVPNTHIDDKTLCLVLGRKEHHEYVNSYNDVMLALFRTNHDIRFLLGGTTDALYYAMKYVTKASEPNAAVERAIMAAYERRRRIDSQKSSEGKSIERFRKGRSLINSMAMAVSRMQEVPSPLCALYLRKKTALYASHGFSKLLLGQVMAIVEKGEHDSELVMRNDGVYVSATQYMDYVSRADELEDVCLVRFVSKFRRATLPRKKDLQPCGDVCKGVYKFRDDHPLMKSHCIVTRKVTVIPEIIGPRIPDAEKLNADSEKERYGKIAMILFSPFRNHADLKRGKSSYWEGYEEFSKSGGLLPWSRRMLDNMQEYYVSKRNSAAEREVLAERKTLYSEEDAEAGGPVNLEDDADFGEEEQEYYNGSAGMSSLSMALEGIEGKFQHHTDAVCSDARVQASVDICANENKSHIERNSENTLTKSFEKDFCNLETSEVEIDGRCVLSGYRSLSELAHTSFQGSMAPGNSLKPCDQIKSCCHDEEEETTVERLKDILKQMDDMQNEETMKDSFKCMHYMSPFRVSDIFSLNKLQKRAFLVAARALLERIQDGLEDSRIMKRREPFRMYLGGEGGTGKTTVIEALLFLGKSWARPGAVRTCAPTGMAACLVQGQTVHSFLGIRAGRSFNPKRFRIPSKAKEFHAGTLMLIIDEVSMLGRETLGAMDCFLRQVKECDIPFGGVAVIFAGDFFQISPVGSEPVYADPKMSGKVSSILDNIGYQAWQDIDYAIVLQESMRHSEDKKFGECLGRVRRGKVTGEDLRILNSRVISKEHTGFAVFGGDFHLVVRTNELRMALNWKAVKACSEALSMKPIVCVAEVRNEYRQNLPVDDLETLMTMDDSQTSNVAIVLPLLPFMPIRISHNVAVDLGIANGAQGVLVGVSFQEGTSFEEATLFGVKCHVCMKFPTAVFVRSELFKKTLPTRFPNLPSQHTSNTVPITTLVQEDVVLKGRGRLRSKLKLSITQFPIVPCYSSTTYKVQGSTAAGVVAFPFVRGCRGAPPTAALYVVLSRVRRLSSLFLTEEITKEDLQYFIPSDVLVKEEERLLVLHERTVRIA